MFEGISMFKPSAAEDMIIQVLSGTFDPAHEQGGKFNINAQLNTWTLFLKFFT